MTFNAFDLSVQNGSPTELYKFNYGSESYRFCTLDGGVQPFVFLAEEYIPATIGHSELETTEEIPRSGIEITVPKDTALAKIFISGPPESVITYTLFGLHVGDTDLEYIVESKGRVLSGGFFKEDELTLSCESIFTSLRRPGIRKVYNSQCDYGLYDGDCRLRKDDWQVPGSVLDALGIQVVVQQAGNYPDDYFKGGPFECGSVKRVVVEHKGVNLTLMHPVPASIINQPCKIAPGCDHTRGENGCSRFKTVDQPEGNGINFGGEPWIPEKNPYTGDNIFW